jgi:hypothetical protein
MDSVHTIPTSEAYLDNDTDMKRGKIAVALGRFGSLFEYDTLVADN